MESNVNEEMKQWLERNAKRSAPKIRKSEVFTGLLKPIILVADQTMEIPKSLLKIAVHVECVDMSDPHCMQKAADALGDCLKKAQERGEI